MVYMVYMVSVNFILRILLPPIWNFWHHTLSSRYCATYDNL